MGATGGSALDPIGLFSKKPTPVRMPQGQQPGIAAPVGAYSPATQQQLPAEQYLAQLQQTMGSMRGF